MAEPKKHPIRARTTDRAIEKPRDPHLIEMARRRQTSFGMLAGGVSLSLEEALAPLDEDEVKAWSLD